MQSHLAYKHTKMCVLIRHTIYESLTKTIQRWMVDIYGYKFLKKTTGKSLKWIVYAFHKCYLKVLYRQNSYNIAFIPEEWMSLWNPYSLSLNFICIFTRTACGLYKFGGNCIEITTSTVLTHIHTENISSHEICGEICL